MDTQYRKNLKSVLTASKDYTDNSIEKLKWELGTYDLSVTTDSTVAYTKTIPTNTIKGRLNYIGGASKVSANLKDLNYTTINYYRTNSTAFITTQDTNTTRIRTESVPFKAIANKTYYVNNIPSGIRIIGVAGFDSSQQTIESAFTSSDNSFTTTSSSVEYIFILFGGSDFNDNTKTLFNQIGIFKTNIYEPYFENIRSAKTTSVKFEGANVLNPDNTFTYSTYTDLAYFECVGGATYTLKSFGSYTGSFGIFKYDGNSWSSIEAHTLNSGYTITAPSDAIRIGVNGVVSQSVMAVRGSVAPTTYQPYIAPITKAIPSEIQALEGYGIGIDDTTYNYVDLINKKFVQDCKKIVVDSSTNYSYISSTFSQATISTQVPYKAPTTAFSKIWVNNDNINEITQETNGGLLVKFINNYSSQQELRQAMLGVEIVYELATPVETDISQYIDDDFKTIDTTNMTTITFENEFEYDVPSEIDYLIEEVKA